MSGEVKSLFRTDDYTDTFGVVKLEEWPDGLVLWVGGKICWESWVKTTLDDGHGWVRHVAPIKPETIQAGRMPPED